jgi:hypothetical protein
MRLRSTVPNQASPNGDAARRMLQDDSSPRNWSELGRRVLAEALRRATDKLAQRRPNAAAPAAHRFPPEGLS